MLAPSYLAMVLSWMVHPMKNWMRGQQENTPKSGHLLREQPCIRQHPEYLHVLYHISFIIGL